MGEVAPSKLNGAARREWLVAGGISLVAVVLHVLFLTHAGGLWRDEANTAQVATMPSLGELWHELTHDSFPALYPVLLRLWSAVDGSFRSPGVELAVSDTMNRRSG